MSFRIRKEIAAAAALALFTLTACGKPRSGEERTEGEHAGRDFSVYDLGSTWHDQSGAARSLASLRGRPQVLALIYTNCTSICPLTVTAMQEVEAKSAGNVGFVLVSMDPERDSPARLAEFARQRQLSSRWTLLSGDENAVRELAALLGVKYRKVSPTEIVHTSTLTILDMEGRMAAQYSETDAVDRATRALRRMARSPNAIN